MNRELLLNLIFLESKGIENKIIGYEVVICPKQLKQLGWKMQARKLKMS